MIFFINRSNVSGETFSNIFPFTFLLIHNPKHILKNSFLSPITAKNRQKRRFSAVFTKIYLIFTAFLAVFATFPTFSFNDLRPFVNSASSAGPIFSALTALQQ